ncbi:hypothetical protein MKEN_01344800 [Mycena kentingensis (nom. inval.)]|nr:hypothetical protein MKEN_01344800 [Mycena kentingensis (nom. inval.)]
MSHLPLELLEKIADYVGPSKSSLASLSLVATAFIAPSQRALFREVRVASGDNLTYAARDFGNTDWRPLASAATLHSTLSSSPHLWTYIRDLQIGIAGDDENDNYNVVALLAGTNRLERLLLLRWRAWMDAVPAPIVVAAARCIAQPSLRSFELFYFSSSPIELILAGLHVEDFCLRLIGLYNLDVLLEDQATIELPSMGPSRLRTLQLLQSSVYAPLYRFLSSDKGAVFARRIQRLDIMVGLAYGQETFVSFMVACAPNLQDLRLRFDGHPPARAFMPSALPSLRALDYELPGSQIDQKPRTLRVLLDLISASPRLETLRIRLVCGNVDFWVTSRPPNAKAWPWPVDAIVQWPSALERVECILEIVRVELEGTSTGRFNADDILRHFKQAVTPCIDRIPTFERVYSVKIRK